MGLGSGLGLGSRRPAQRAPLGNCAHGSSATCTSRAASSAALKCGWFFCPALGARTRRSQSSASAIVAADERAKKRPAHLRVRVS